MAVSNFAAAPTGGSLITKFLKQPCGVAREQHKEEPDVQEGQLMPGQSKHAQDADELPATHEPSHPDAAADQVKHTAEGKQHCQDDRQVLIEGHHALTHNHSLPVHQVLPQSSSSPASIPFAVSGSESAQAQASLTCTTAPQPSAGHSHSDAGPSSTATALQRQSSALPQEATVIAEPYMFNKSAQRLSPDPAPAAIAAAAASGSHDSGHAGTASIASTREEDTSGAASRPVEAQAAGSSSFGRFLQVQQLADRGSVKRPLEQAFAKEPEHRKKPNRSGKTACMLTCLLFFAMALVFYAINLQAICVMQKGDAHTP